jgi:hypothetical protein
LVDGAETGSPAAPLQLRPKAALAAVANPSAVPKNYAPFANPSAQDPGLELVAPPMSSQEQRKPGCSKSAALCYEADTGRIVFKPARQFMPEIPGLQRENISLNRHRILFKYSF